MLMLLLHTSTTPFRLSKVPQRMLNSCHYRCHRTEVTTADKSNTNPGVLPSDPPITGTPIPARPCMPLCWSDAVQPSPLHKNCSRHSRAVSLKAGRPEVRRFLQKLQSGKVSEVRWGKRHTEDTLLDEELFSVGGRRWSTHSQLLRYKPVNWSMQHCYNDGPLLLLIQTTISSPAPSRSVVLSQTVA